MTINVKRSNDHGQFKGLTDDDHTQYFLLAGRSGGQTAIGGTGSGDDLTFNSTNDATKGSILFGSSDGMNYNETDTMLSIGGPGQEVVIAGTTYKSRFTTHIADATVASARYGGHSGTAVIAPNLLFNRSQGTEGSPTAVAEDDRLGILQFAGHDGTDYNYAASIQVDVDGTPGANDMPGRIVFSVSPDGSNTPAEAVKILNDKSVEFVGDLGIGLTPDVLYGLKTNKDIRTSGKVWSDQTLRTNAIQPQSSGTNLDLYTIGTGTFRFLPGGIEKVTIAVDGTISSLGSLSDGTTSVDITEIVDFFNATDITGAQAETLTDGSNADSLHIHTSTAGISDMPSTLSGQGTKMLVVNGGGTAYTLQLQPAITKSFTIWDADLGTNPQSSGVADTMIVTSANSSIDITGDSVADSLTFDIDLTKANTWSADVTTTGDFVVSSHKYGASGVSVPTGGQAFHASAAPNAGMAFIGAGGNRLIMTDTGGTEFFQARLNSNIVLGATSALNTGATNGFTYIPTMAGAPTAAPPTTFTGKVPMVYDTTNNKLYVYNAAWKGVTLA